jgi:hypothetical protein
MTTRHPGFADSRLTLPPGLLCQQHYESRPEANLRVVGTPRTVVFNDVVRSVGRRSNLT